MLERLADENDELKDEVKPPSDENRKYFKIIRAHRIYQLAMCKYKEMRYLGGKQQLLEEVVQ